MGVPAHGGRGVFRVRFGALGRRAAVAAQPALPVPVRMGVATGEAELRGEDYSGRSSTAPPGWWRGAGGQVLLGGTTASLFAGVDLIPSGHRFRDLAKHLEMFQVLAVGLRREFPALRTLDATPGNLRPQTSSLVGRDAELAEERGRWRRIDGDVDRARRDRQDPPGPEVASRVADEFPDGVWLVELAAVADPAAVPDAVAAVLGITQQPGKSVGEAGRRVDGRVRLLVFDNCEHVLDAAADLVEAILAHSATVRVSAPAGKGGGRRRAVVAGALAGLDAGNDSAAVALFVERARRLPRASRWHG